MHVSILISKYVVYFQETILLFYPIKMSSTSSRISLFFVDPFTLSNNSLFYVDEYNYLHVKNKEHQSLNCDVTKRSNSMFSIDPLNSSSSELSKQCVDSGKVDTSIDEACVKEPINFRKIPRQVSSKQLNFLTSDRQIVLDTNKSCCGSLCLSKFGKANLRGLQQKYLSLNGDEQDTFLISHRQLVLDDTGGAISMHVEYYLALCTKCCQVAFKIAYSIGNIRLQRTQL